MMVGMVGNVFSNFRPQADTWSFPKYNTMQNLLPTFAKRTNPNTQLDPHARSLLNCKRRIRELEDT